MLGPSLPSSRYQKKENFLLVLSSLFVPMASGRVVRGPKKVYKKTKIVLTDSHPCPILFLIRVTPSFF